MYKRPQSVISLFLLLFMIPLMLQYADAQEKTSFSMEPVSDEAFQVIVQCYQYDRDMPLDARIVEKSNYPDYVREKIVFNGIRDSRVPGYLAVPKKGSPPYPCILLMHGYTGNKGEWWEDSSFYGGGLVTKQFVPAGFAVFALDAQYHGERAANNDFEKPDLMRDRGWSARSIEMIIQSVTEYCRAIDYLETRQDIDSSRIGVHGYSMGGMMAFLLTGIEPRVRVTVSCVTWNWDVDTPKYTLIAPHNFARAVGNRPFLMLMGRSDPILPDDAARRLYNLVGGQEKNLIFYDSGHRLPDEYISESLLWFEKYLK